MGGLRGLRGQCIALACALLTGGCGFFVPDRIHYTWSAESGAPCEACVPGPPGESMVGLAFSGGGSRAAVFAAAAAEALSSRGFLDGVTHLSSVSGGSFAAAYLSAIPPPDCPGAADEAGRRACRAAYFDAFRQAMREDYFLATLQRQIVNLNRLTSPTRRVSSLQDALDARFLADRTFGDLAPDPVLLINAASFDTARRFVFTNLVIPDEPGGAGLRSREVLRTGSFSLPGCPRGTPGDLPVSLAVATSAAFPPVFGPTTLRVPAACEGDGAEYWHLGDGGILDNSGVETLQEIVLAGLEAGAPIRRVLILSIHAGLPLDPEASRASSDLSLWTSDPGRVVTIANRRAEAYRALFWEGAAAGLGIDYEVVTLRYLDADLAEWPASCPEALRRSDSPRDHLRGVPTDLEITPCDADLVEAAAHLLVARALTPERMAELAGRGFLF